MRNKKHCSVNHCQVIVSEPYSLMCFRIEQEHPTLKRVVQIVCSPLKPFSIVINLPAITKAGLQLVRNLIKWMCICVTKIAKN